MSKIFNPIFVVEVVSVKVSRNANANVKKDCFDC